MTWLLVTALIGFIFGASLSNQVLRFSSIKLHMEEMVQQSDKPLFDERGREVERPMVNYLTIAEYKLDRPAGQDVWVSGNVLLFSFLFGLAGAGFLGVWFFFTSLLLQKS